MTARLDCLCFRGHRDLFRVDRLDHGLGDRHRLRVPVCLLSGMTSHPGYSTCDLYHESGLWKVVLGPCFLICQKRNVNRFRNDPHFYCRPQAFHHDCGGCLQRLRRGLRE